MSDFALTCKCCGGTGREKPPLNLVDMLKDLPALAWIKPSDVRDEQIPQVAKNLRAKSDEDLVAMWMWAEQGRAGKPWHDTARYVVTIAQRWDFNALGDVAYSTLVPPLDLSEKEDRSIYDQHERGLQAEAMRRRGLCQLEMFGLPRGGA